MSEICKDPMKCTPGLAVRLAKIMDIFEILDHPLRIIETVRTIERQRELYDQGRTKPGAIVTNATPGTSNHSPDEQGLSWAVDFAFAGREPYGDFHPWTLLGQIGETLGLRWGGRWRLKDMGHLELPKLPNGGLSDA